MDQDVGYCQGLSFVAGILLMHVSTLMSASFILLKAYSLMDQDVGYCQGLSFVAGILLMHVSTLMVN